MKRITFNKINSRWFVDIPYDGDQEDLEMVLGADLLLDSLPIIGEDYKIIEITDKETTNKLTKINEDEYGCTYLAETIGYNGEIWLCNVTKIVLGCFPDFIYFRILMI